jgi:PPOX class probable F420-dependent enzyme
MDHRVPIAFEGQTTFVAGGRILTSDATFALRENVGMTTFPESHRDLLNAQVASLATIGANGFPQLTEVWFLLDDDELKLSLNTSRVKTRNLLKRPQCSLLVLDLENPYRYLEVRGTAKIQPDDDYEFARKVGAKYDADLKVHDQPQDSRVVITIEPINIYPVDMSGG